MLVVGGDNLRTEFLLIGDDEAIAFLSPPDGIGVGIILL